MNDADLALLSSIPPEQLQKMLGLGSMDERGDLIQQQMAQAMALRKPSQVQHSTGMGAAFGGLADVINGATGTYQMGQLQKQQGALLDQKDAGRGDYVKAMTDALRGGGQAGFAAYPGAPAAAPVSAPPMLAADVPLPAGADGFRVSTRVGSRKPKRPSTGDPQLDAIAQMQDDALGG